MRTLKVVSWPLLLALVTGCGTVPQSRDHYIQLLQEADGWGSSQKLITEVVVASPFDQAVANIDDKLKRCVPDGFEQTTVSNNMPTSTAVTNNRRIVVTASGRAEVTVQQHHTNMYMQSEGGMYLLAADIERLSADEVRIEFYTSNHYRPLMEAIQNWAGGSERCHGIGGTD